MSEQEERSLTRSELEIGEEDRLVYAEAIRTLNGAGVDYVVSGLFALHAYTGISRQVNDLDVLLEPEQVTRAAGALADRGFEPTLAERHWLAKARHDGRTVDLVFGMSNGLCLIDRSWIHRGVRGTVCGEPALLASPEDLIFHRLFISERHRFDMSDVVHLILIRHHELDWEEILDRAGEHWRLLLVQIVFFDFTYPHRREHVPEWVRAELLRRQEEQPAKELQVPAASHNGTRNGSEPCQGTLISRFSFAVDVNDWHFRDRRAESVAATLERPEIEAIAGDPVWTGGGAGTDRPQEEGS